MSDELKMTVSPICSENGKKYAYVLFSDAGKEAEGRIPDCTVISNKGFSSDEVHQLEEYMKKELAQLKKMSAQLNVVSAFMK